MGNFWLFSQFSENRQWRSGNCWGNKSHGWLSLTHILGTLSSFYREGGKNCHFKQNFRQGSQWWLTIPQLAGMWEIENNRVHHWLSDYTHTQLFYGSGFCPGQPGWAVTRRNIPHSHQLWSSVIPYLLPPSFMIHGILPAQFTCLTVFFSQPLSNLSLVYLRWCHWCVIKSWAQCFTTELAPCGLWGLSK